MRTVDQEVKTAIAKDLERVEALPIEKRMREYKDLLLKVNPELIPVDRQFIEDIKEIREDQANEFASSKDRSMRHLIEMPRYLYDALLVADEEFGRLVSSKDKGESKKLWQMMAKVFPEYRIAGQI